MENEKRLIDANALVEHIKDLPTWWADDGGVYPGSVKYPDGMFYPDDIISSIDNAPTVDAVEVVRCKDCKHRGEEVECPMYFVKEIEWDDDGYTECDYVPYDRTVDDGFCDRGERGEGE